MAGNPPVPAHLAAAARALVMDSVSGAAWRHLSAAGVPAILLKGSAVAAWLYPDEVRGTNDVDLLVPPAHFARAQAVLAGRGYRPHLPGAPPCEVGPNSMLLFSGDGVCIDLHHRLIGTAGPPDRCWEVLARHTATLRLACGIEVAVLDLPARAMHLALHAAQDGRSGTKALADLERGIAAASRATWRQAAAVAAEVDATAAFAAGLRLSPAGSRLTAELGLPGRMSVELALRSASAPQEALFFTRLAAVPGLAGKLRVLARKAWPTPAFMRATDATAGRGRAGLLVARARRAAGLPARALPALRALRAARRSAARSRSA